MRKHLATLLAAMASIIFAGEEARAVDIYVTTNNFTGGGVGFTTDFGRIDSATGAYTSIASINGNVWNLAWNPAAENFFVTEGFSTNMTLRTLTRSGTMSSSLGTSNATLYGMAYRTSDSTLYGYNYSDDSTGTINTANGAWSELNLSPGVSTSTPLGGRYSIMNDTMYFANATGPSTGGIGTMGYTASSNYLQIASDPVYVNMVLANDGTTMYGIFGNGVAGQQRLYTIDVATGVATAGAFITGTGLGTRFHGAGIVPVPVPEPSTYALGGISVMTLGYLARRRRRIQSQKA